MLKADSHEDLHMYEVSSPIPLRSHLSAPSSVTPGVSLVPYQENSTYFHPCSLPQPGMSVGPATTVSLYRLHGQSQGEPRRLMSLI